VAIDVLFYVIYHNCVAKSGYWSCGDHTIYNSKFWDVHTVAILSTELIRSQITFNYGIFAWLKSSVGIPREYLRILCYHIWLKFFPGLNACQFHHLYHLYQISIKILPACTSVHAIEMSKRDSSKQLASAKFSLGECFPKLLIHASTYTIILLTVNLWHIHTAFLSSYCNQYSVCRFAVLLQLP